MACSVQGVAKFMIEKGSDYDGLCTFLKQEMGLPFQLHAVHRDILLAVGSAQKSPDQLNTQNVLEIIADTLLLKPSWLAFAADSAELFSSKGHFVEKTEEA